MKQETKNQASENPHIVDFVKNILHEDIVENWQKMMEYDVGKSLSAFNSELLPQDQLTIGDVHEYLDARIWSNYDPQDMNPEVLARGYLLVEEIVIRESESK